MVNELLRQARVQRNWTQSTLAAQLNTTRITVARWEQGQTIPSLYFREQLCQIFGMNSQSLGFIKNEPIDREQTLYLLPEKRNPFFGGRAALLQQITAIFTQQSIQVVVLNGLAGIGKTQIALEYAYQSQQNYDTILWLHAQTLTALNASLLQLAIALQLVSHQETDEQRARQAFVLWVRTAQNWLLIFDQVEDLSLVHSLLPTHTIQGHILLTTRLPATGRVGWNLTIPPMNTEEGACFLLRRARLLTFDQTLEQANEKLRSYAVELCRLFGGHSLALEQAGAYIEETGCSLSGYLERFQQNRTALLTWCGRSPGSPSVSIAMTILEAFKQIQSRSPLAVEFLSRCLFLHPAGIAEKLISYPTEGEYQQPLSNLFQLDQAFALLNASALLRRDPEDHQITLHPLVQTILRDQLTPEQQHHWIEWTLQTLIQFFPFHPGQNTGNWPRPERFLSHALYCLGLIEQAGINEQQDAILLLRKRLLAEITLYRLGQGHSPETHVLHTNHILDTEAAGTSTQLILAQTQSTLSSVDEQLEWYQSMRTGRQALSSIQRISIHEKMVAPL
ncbi:helix-turn-helix domain-containing protein [Tengunoibacter tsumagoiensis]|uniref:HTH cro/C1-type domain-containing protein n=1 Tax=Tengunoibacter tsumagoiensis TaxID=2014871 RepID=A0A402A183_9CHLR|nr:helix-turn-helix transcriptional regulator [Tengunoibacter tsumagoiensis]GCE12816.1 hypothetical protein KTT_26750 [Tengunoibacter tsumagoiensis]